VEWRGPLARLTHTECVRCGAINAQISEEDVPEEDVPENENDEMEEELDDVRAELAQVTRERDAMQRHFDEAGDGLNLLWLLDVYKARWHEAADSRRQACDAARRLEDEIFEARAAVGEAWLNGRVSLAGAIRRKMRALDPPEAVEPGETICHVRCPCCGAEIEIMHGDDPGMFATLGSPVADAARCRGPRGDK